MNTRGSQKHLASPRTGTRRRTRAVRAGLAGLIAATLVLEGHAIAAGSSGCGEYSFGFEGTRLLNDGISTSAGPYTISLPAGTYDVTMVSRDHHDLHPGQSEQTQEQWYFKLDSGYVSPPANDIPDDINDMTTVVGAQEIGASTEISVHHLLEGGVNSVEVVCVGFTTVTVAGPVDPEPEPEPDPEPDPDPSVVDPDPDPDPSSVDPEPEPEPEVAAPADPEPEPEAPKAVVDPAPTPEVAAKVETPVAQLANTGPPELVLAFFGAGLFLVGYGIVLLNLEAAGPALAWARNRTRR